MTKSFEVHIQAAADGRWHRDYRRMIEHDARRLADTMRQKFKHAIMAVSVLSAEGPPTHAWVEGRVVDVEKGPLDRWGEPAAMTRALETVREGRTARATVLWANLADEATQRWSTAWYVRFDGCPSPAAPPSARHHRVVVSKGELIQVLTPDGTELVRFARKV